MPKSILFYIISVLLLTLIVGPFASIPTAIPGLSLYLSDVLCGILLFYWILKFNSLIKIVKKETIFPPLILFLLVLIISNICSPVSLDFLERILSTLYFVRFLGYVAVFVTVWNLIKQNTMSGRSFYMILSLVGVVLASIGWIQYFLYPDLRNLMYLGWDPHYKRIFATYFDPNYLGLILILTLLLSLATIQSKKIKVITIGFLFITLLFTYSRSSFVAATFSLGYYWILQKRVWLLFLLFIGIVFGMLMLPRGVGEGVKLERMFSIQNRLNNWKEGIALFAKYPYLGVGFNTIRYARKQYLFASPEDAISHAGAGVDNSLLFILITSGIVGMIVFLFFLIRLFVVSSALGKCVILAIMIHGLFLNSFFYPWIMLMFWTIMGVERANFFKENKRL